MEYHNYKTLKSMLDSLKVLEDLIMTPENTANYMKHSDKIKYESALDKYSY